MHARLKQKTINLANQKISAVKTKHRTTQFFYLLRISENYIILQNNRTCQQVLNDNVISFELMTAENKQTKHIDPSASAGSTGGPFQTKCNQRVVKLGPLSNKRETNYFYGPWLPGRVNLNSVLIHSALNRFNDSSVIVKAQFQKIGIYFSLIENAILKKQHLQSNGKGLHLVLRSLILDEYYNFLFIEVINWYIELARIQNRIQQKIRRKLLENIHQIGPHDPNDFSKGLQLYLSACLFLCVLLSSALADISFPIMLDLPKKFTQPSFLDLADELWKKFQVVSAVGKKLRKSSFSFDGLGSEDLHIFIKVGYWLKELSEFFSTLGVASLLSADLSGIESYKLTPKGLWESVSFVLPNRTLGVRSPGSGSYYLIWSASARSQTYCCQSELLLSGSSCDYFLVQRPRKSPTILLIFSWPSLLRRRPWLRSSQILRFKNSLLTGQPLTIPLLPCLGTWQSFFTVFLLKLESLFPGSWTQLSLMIFSIEFSYQSSETSVLAAPFLSWSSLRRFQRYSSYYLMAFYIVAGLTRSYSEFMRTLHSSYSMFSSSLSLGMHLSKMMLNGNTKNTAARAPATMLGVKEESSISISVICRMWDQHRAPRAKKMGPRLTICPIAMLMRSVPGTGLRMRLSRAYFSIQYMLIMPMIVKMQMQGCRVTKNAVNRYKLMKQMYSYPVSNYISCWESLSLT